MDLWCKVSTVLRFAQATRASASLGRLHPMMSPSIDLSLAITAVAIKQMMVGPRQSFMIRDMAAGLGWDAPVGDMY